MKKIYNNLIILLTVLTLTVTMTSCSKTKELSININDMLIDATKAAQFQDDMIELDSDVLSNIYSTLNMDDVVEFKVITASTSVKAEEIAIFKASDLNTAQKVLKAVNDRLEDIKSGFDNYLPQELKVAENAIVRTEGCYVIFAMGENYQEMNKVFDSYINK